MSGDQAAPQWDGRARPAWWPEDEPFPPSAWPRTRRRFMRRFAVFALLAFLGFALVLAFVVSLLAQAFTAIAGGPPHPIVMAAMLVVLLFLLTGGARSARRLAARLGDLIEAAERVQAGDYTTRVRVRGPRELRALGDAFNAMSARLERSEGERRRLLADVTHELRTPLTVVQGNIEALIDGVHPADEAHLRTILDETHVIARLIDDLRTVSVAEAGALALHRESIDVSDLVRDVASAFGTRAAEQGVHLDAVARGPLLADVDPIRVREVLSNIIANALRYTPRGGSVMVTATADPDVVRVSVHDSGPGIAADMLPHVFERFTRSADSPGAGLGLAIAKSLVEAHGGTIEAESAPGQGTLIRFRLTRGTFV